jgi:signal transduction histidine kinase
VEYCKRGIGLGLPLVRRFVELHHGEVEVESSPGEGTRFIVRFPRRQPPPPREQIAGVPVRSA